MNPKIIILGGNAETVSIFKLAQSMGYFTIACIPYSESPVKLIADQAFEVDPANFLAVDQIIRDENVTAVVLGVSDPLLPAYLEICQRNQLKCYASNLSVGAFSSKSSFFEICKKYELTPIPQFSLDILLEESNNDVNYPVVVKPVDGGAAVGVSLCNSIEELRVGVKTALDASRKKKVVIEKAMFCDDIFAYYTFIDGEPFLTAVADRIKSEKQGAMQRVCLIANYPSQHLRLFQKKVHPKLIKMFKDLEINVGVLCIQFFFDGTDFYPYDPGFRIQGEAPHIYVNAIYGLDHREMLINFATGNPLNSKKFQELCDPAFEGKSARTIWVLGKPGIVAQIEGIDKIQGISEVISIQARFNVNDQITEEMMGTERQVLMRIHLLGETAAVIDNVNSLIANKLHIRDAEGKSLIQDIYNPLNASAKKF